MSGPPVPAHQPPTSALAQLRAQWSTPRSAARETEFPPIRNFVLDVMTEGRRKNIINLVMQADITALLSTLGSTPPGEGVAMSVTSAVAAALVQALQEHPGFNAYRQGGSKLVLFDDIDLSFTVERDLDGTLVPVPCIVRAANRKSAAQIHGELQAAKIAPLGQTGPMSALEKSFFLSPRFLRSLVWFFIRRDPYKFKQLAGTVGVTSMGMFAGGAMVVQPITPMTLTLSIGTIEKRPMWINDMPGERAFIHLNLGADHDIIDGAPLMRFAESFRLALEHPPAPA
ncbi:MAG: 2-oxo acid dehydrogenase subunit E2 [Betaproteobacteria bacterium]